jgi:hypothetical protein
VFLRPYLGPAGRFLGSNLKLFLAAADSAIVPPSYPTSLLPPKPIMDFNPLEPIPYAYLNVE